MTALSDALAATQARAVAALGKRYVSGVMDEEQVAAALEAMGLTDEVDATRWVAALTLIKIAGGEAPGEAVPKPKPADVARDDAPHWAEIAEAETDAADAIRDRAADEHERSLDA